jgi:hypothetical protein
MTQLKNGDLFKIVMGMPVSDLGMPITLLASTGRVVTGDTLNETLANLMAQVFSHVSTSRDYDEYNELKSQLMQLIMHNVERASKEHTLNEGDMSRFEIETINVTKTE